MNEDFRKFCDGCGDKRPGAAVTTKGIAMDEILGSSSESLSEESTEFEEAKPKSKPKKAKKEKKSKKKAEEDEETAEPERLEPSVSQPEAFQASTPEPSDDFESKISTGDSESKPSFVLTGPEPSHSSDDTAAPAETFSSFQTPPAPSAAYTPSAPSAPLTSGQHYYLVFVNTPASSLIKTRVAIEFEDFPTVSIGRSPENVVVIPDPEVSRKHASLTFDGSRITLKDLGSSNGSFVYNGREFERVSDSVEVRPNTVLKFGTGTIVKLVSE